MRRKKRKSWESEGCEGRERTPKLAVVGINQVTRGEGGKEGVHIQIWSFSSRLTPRDDRNWTSSSVFGT